MAKKKTDHTRRGTTGNATDSRTAATDPALYWPLSKKLAYVRQRLAAQAKLGRHPDKRLSLWPLTMEESLAVIFQTGSLHPEPVSHTTKEKTEWQRARQELALVRQLLSKGSPDPSPSPPKASKRGRTSRT